MTWLLVIGVSQTSLMVGRFRSTPMLALWEEKNWSLSSTLRWRSVFMLSYCRHPPFRNLNPTVPVDVVRVKSYVDSLLNSTRVPVRSSQLKLQLQLQNPVYNVCSFVQNMERSVATPSESLIRPKTDNNVNFINYCKRNSPLFYRPIHLVLTRTNGLSIYPQGP